ncbi:hypothetical protein [Bartonella sp. DGB2]|uniref:hypothetical protein n=1 Tax=Bartonella sp. DGB2 TaxID=3388426 RepID=UPI00398FD63F
MDKLANAVIKLSLEDKISGPIKRMQTKLNKMGRVTGLSTLSKSVKGLGKAFDNVGAGANKSLGRIAKLTALVGLGSGGLVAGVYGLEKKLTTNALSLNNWAQAIGTSAESLQELQYAGDSFNITADSMGDGLAQMTRRANEFIATGKGKGAEAFAALGYSAQSLKEKMKDPAALFGDLIERMGQMKKEGQQGLSEQVFGLDKGPQFLAFMGKTREEIKAMRQEARASGSIIGDDAVAGALDLNNSMKGLSDRFSTFTKRISVGFMPILKETLDWLNQLIDANKNLINDKIKEGLEWFKGTLKDLKDPTSDLRKSIDDWAESFKWVYNCIKPVASFLSNHLKLALVGVGLYIAGPLIGALAALVPAFISLGAAMLATPIGWLIVGISALVLAIKNWRSITDFLASSWEKVVDVFSNVVNYISSIDFLGLGKRIIGFLWEGIKTGWNWITDFFATCFDFITDVISNIGSRMLNFGKGICSFLWNGLKLGWNNLTKWLQDKIMGLISWMPNWVKNKLGLNVGATVTTKSVEEVQRNIVSDGNSQLEADAQAQAKIASSQPQTPTATIPRLSGYSAPNTVAYNPSITISNLTVQSNGDVKDVAAQIKRTLQDMAMQQRRELMAQLGDLA